MKSAFFKHHYRVRATHGDTPGSEYGKKSKDHAEQARKRAEKLSHTGGVQGQWFTILTHNRDQKKKKDKLLQIRIKRLNASSAQRLSHNWLSNDVVGLPTSVHIDQS